MVAETRRHSRWRPDAIYDQPADIYAPCALGATINDDTIPRLKVEIVAGGANNQLAEDRHGDELEQRGMLYAPDYVINGGGVINVYGELHRWPAERALEEGGGDLRHPAADLRDRPDRRRFPPTGRRTGWPSSGIAAVAGLDRDVDGGQALARHPLPLPHSIPCTLGTRCPKSFPSAPTTPGSR